MPYVSNANNNPEAIYSAFKGISWINGGTFMVKDQAGMKKRVTPHTLRHSFASYLLEAGVNLRNIQVLLGHNSSKTTEIYTHVANNIISKIINPLDSIFLNK